MPLSLRELNWMLAAKLEVHNESLGCVLDAIYSSMASQMAMMEATHTRRRVNPEKYYKPRAKRRKLEQIEINHDGFEMMKHAFVDDTESGVIQLVPPQKVE